MSLKYLKSHRKKITPINYLTSERKSICRTINDDLVMGSILEVFKLFCKETNLHGMKHIVGSKNGYSKWHKRMAVRISRILWFFSCIAGIAFAITLMSLVWARFQTNPTITTIDTTNHPIWMVPFPSVTICNINKVYKPHAENITQMLLAEGVPMNTILKFYETLPSLIYPEHMTYDFPNISSILEDFGYNTETLMLGMVQPCDHMLRMCFWKGHEFPCGDLFKLSRSSEGMCCSFNYKALKPSLEVNQDFNSQNIFYVSGTGRNMGLHVLIDAETEQSLSLAKSLYGVEVLIHDAEQFPQASVTTGIAQPGQEVIMSIVPQTMTSRPSVRDVPFAERQCFFSDEVKLRATQKYSLNSCLAECQVDFIIAKCDCVPFFYPEIPLLINKYRQCGFTDVACLRKYRTFFSSVQPPENTVGFNMSGEIGMDCTCLPSCSHQTYQVTTISAQRTPHRPSAMYHHMDMTNLTTLYVYFRDLNVIRYRRDIYMSWDGLFASFGGIFGLCLGGSMLSLVEMSYFFTVKLVLTIYRRYKARKHATPDYERRFQKNLAASRKLYAISPKVQQRNQKNAKIVW